MKQLSKIKFEEYEIEINGNFITFNTNFTNNAEEYSIFSILSLTTSNYRNGECGYIVKFIDGTSHFIPKEAYDILKKLINKGK